MRGSVETKTHEYHVSTSKSTTAIAGSYVTNADSSSSPLGPRECLHERHATARGRASRRRHPETIGRFPSRAARRGRAESARSLASRGEKRENVSRRLVSATLEIPAGKACLPFQHPGVHDGVPHRDPRDARSPAREKKAKRADPEPGPNVAQRRAPREGREKKRAKRRLRRRRDVAVDGHNGNGFWIPLERCRLRRFGFGSLPRDFVRRHARAARVSRAARRADRRNRDPRRDRDPRTRRRSATARRFSRAGTPDGTATPRSPRTRTAPRTTSARSLSRAREPCVAIASSRRACARETPPPTRGSPQAPSFALLVKRVVAARRLVRGLEILFGSCRAVSCVDVSAETPRLDSALSRAVVVFRRFAARGGSGGAEEKSGSREVGPAPRRSRKNDASSSSRGSAGAHRGTASGSVTPGSVDASSHAQMPDRSSSVSSMSRPRSGNGE